MGEPLKDLDAALTRTGPILSALAAEPRAIPAAAAERLWNAVGIRKPVTRTLRSRDLGTVLLTILAEGPATGFELAQRLEADGLRTKGGAEGILYGVLDQLEGQGWVSGEWREKGVQISRRYRITEPGSRHLKSASDPKSAAEPGWDGACDSRSGHV